MLFAIPNRWKKKEIASVFVTIKTIRSFRIVFSYAEDLQDVAVQYNLRPRQYESDLKFSILHKYKNQPTRVPSNPTLSHSH